MDALSGGDGAGPGFEGAMKSSWKEKEDDAMEEKMLIDMYESEGGGVLMEATCSPLCVMIQ